LDCVEIVGKENDDQIAKGASLWVRVAVGGAGWGHPRTPDALALCSCLL